MTFQTSLAQVPDEQLAHRSSEMLTPLGDALLAESKLSILDWLFERMSFAARVDEAQLGKAVSAFRGPMRRLAPTSHALTLADAQQQVREAGVEGRVKVFEGQREDALKLEIDRAQTKQKYEQIVAHADQGWGTQFLIGATGVVVDFADPVNLATMALPAVGAGKVVYGLAKATAKLAPLASKIIVRAGAGAYEGAVSTAMAEPLNFAVHRSLGEEYGLSDGVSNIVTNAMGGAALRVLGGAGLDLYRGMRVRPDLGLDGTIRVVGGGAQQIGSLEPVNVSGLVGQEQAVLTRASAQASLPVATPIKKRTGQGYARNSILAMPGSGASGERVTLSDLANLKAVLSEYDPVPSSGSEIRVGASAGDVYKIRRGDDIVAYTLSREVKGSPTTYTVERLPTDNAEHAGQLSEKKGVDTSRKDAQVDRLLYIHAPKALAERFAKTLEATVADLERLEPQQLYSHFQPSEAAGNTVDTHIGRAMHVTLTEHTHGSDELHLLKKKNGAQPDGDLTGTKLLLDLKRDSPRGRKNGQESWRKYWKRLDRDTVILLYDVTQHETRITNMNKRVTDVWNQLQPTWWNLVADRKARAGSRGQRLKREKRG